MLHMGHPSPYAATSIYHGPNIQILEVVITFKSTQEERDTHLVESHNEKQIYR